MKALVTGAAGFIGSHLTDKLILLGYNVIGIDNLISGSLDNIKHLKNSPQFTFEIHDVRKPIKKKADIIFNFACPASPVCYQKYPIPTFNTSIMGAQHLAELAKQLGCTLIHASTSEVYGDPLVNPQSENYWGNVNPVGPRACYDVGKRAAETYLTDAERTFGIDARIIRIFNTYGPRMRPDDGRVISNFIVQALYNEPLFIYGNGKQTRSLCYVDDLVEGIIRVANLNSLDGPINLGNPHETTIHDLAQEVIRMVGSSSALMYSPAPVDDPKQRCPDITKAIQLLKFRAKVPLEQGLQRTVDYFRTMHAN